MKIENRHVYIYVMTSNFPIYWVINSTIILIYSLKPSK